MMKKEIKILFLSHSAEIGGAEKSLIELVKGLISRGFICHVVVPGEGSLLNELNKLLVPTYVLFLPWCADGEKEYDKKRMYEIGKSALEIIGLLEKNDFNVVYSNSSVIFQGAIAAKILGIRHIWHIREFGELDYNINYCLPIEKRAKFIFKYSDKIIFISKSLSDYYHRYISDEKSEVVYNNVKIPDNDSDNLKLKKNIELNLLIVGNVHPAKGQLDAVKAIKELKDRGLVDIKLRILGRKLPEYYEKIKDFIDKNKLNDKIEFFDFIPNPSVFFKTSDIVLMCSKSEGFGRVTVEAMLFEKPVIGSFSGGTKEIIKDGGNGLFYEPGNVKDLSDKIEFFYRNRDKIKEFGKNGKSFCENTFNEEKYVGRIENILVNKKNDKNEEFRDLFLSVFKEVENSKSEMTKEILANEKELKIIREKFKYNKEHLYDIRNSREWRIALKIQRIFKFILPKNSLRRTFLFKCLNLFKKIFRFSKKIKSKIILVVDFVYYFLKPRRNRMINLKSKKIVYIDHSYHNKTKSNDFFLEYLKDNFEVTVISDNSWKEDVEFSKDLSFIDKSYLGVIFFQLLPSKGIIDNINNDNIIYVPMYDQSGRLKYEYWRQYRDLKIINFSKALHHKLKRWKFETMYIKYFPKPFSFIPDKNDEAFFWQRLTEININLIEKVLGSQKIKLHVHKAIDPYHNFVEPTTEQEKKYNITYSGWFDTREQMFEFADKKGIYIAPREYEGIGLSFLEAMAKGKAVVAVNKPTMNEYIEHGKTGYLFDLSNPREIDLSNIEEVQKNAYRYMKEGYKVWEKNKINIIEFIKKQ